MEKRNLPSFLKRDLRGYRGMYLTKFPLSIKKVNGKFVGSYANDMAEEALATAVGDTHEEMIDQLYDYLKIYGYI